MVDEWITNGDGKRRLPIQVMVYLRHSTVRRRQSDSKFRPHHGPIAALGRLPQMQHIVGDVVYDTIVVLRNQSHYHTKGVTLGPQDKATGVRRGLVQSRCRVKGAFKGVRHSW